MRRISVCVIAQDEAGSIGACLESASCVAFEAIVVDTGSADHTRRRAAAHGARVVDHEWRNDLAAARNAGLERATGTHVLILDADEVLTPSAGEALASAALDEHLVLAFLPVHDASSLDHTATEVARGTGRRWDPVWSPRLLVNDPRVRFRRRIHESVVEGANLRLTADGGRIDKLDAPIVGYGDALEVESPHRRARRDTALLERALAEDPEDGELAAHLARAYLASGMPDEAHEIAEHALGPWLAALDEIPEHLLRPSPIPLGAILALCQLQRGDHGAALETVREAARRTNDPHPDLTFLEGVALERAGELTGAERCLRDCLALGGRAHLVPASPGVTDRAARLRLANVLLTKGRAEEALHMVDELDGVYALPALYVRAEAQLALGRAADAICTLRPLLDSQRDETDLYALASRALEGVGRPDERLMELVGAAPPEGWLEQRRKELVGQSQRLDA
ncbi:MAG: tetratricopeptide repeat protein [Planctomycetota bacterium]|nr:tetratricopeptide repeat protein [Planctomycetota bacterium]